MKTADKGAAPADHARVGTCIIPPEPRPAPTTTPKPATPSPRSRSGPSPGEQPCNRRGFNHERTHGSTDDLTSAKVEQSYYGHQRRLTETA
jgi:hypothetical protein